jgi:hypothetical protein
MVRNNFELLQITDEHLAGLVDLPFHHKDPFDRMPVAQSLSEQIPTGRSNAIICLAQWRDSNSKGSSYDRKAIPRS